MRNAPAEANLPLEEPGSATRTRPAARPSARGDYVRIKSKEEIAATLDETQRDRGLFFDGEMASYCGRTARVQARVHRLIEGSTGEMIEIKSDRWILEGVVCSANYYRFCTRALYSYWREAWLERIDAPGDNQVTAPCVTTRWSRP